MLLCLIFPLLQLVIDAFEAEEAEGSHRIQNNNSPA